MITPWRRLLLLGLLASASAAWAVTVVPIVPAGDGTFRVTVRADHKFTRNTAKLKDQAMAAAKEFCASQGKALEVVSVQEDKSQYLIGRFAEVTLVFQATAPGEANRAAGGTARAAAPAQPSLTTDELAAELTKLDELRQKGLLTEAEFATLKQKLLSRY
jgi:hypothetical protein